MWHEARKSERALHGIMDAAKKRAERRAEFLAKRKGDPQQALRLVGSRARFHHNLETYQATEDKKGLIPWNGQADTLIDRFDGRALLDFIRDSSRIPAREKTDEEMELEELCQFERYRDLIKHRRRGLTDEEGLEDIEKELEARANATVASRQQRLGNASATAPAGTGAYAKVNFSYDDGGNEDDDSDDDDDEDEEDDDESSEDSEDEEIERIGQDYGVESFNRLLYLDRKAKEEERERKEAAKGSQSLRKLSRKERRKLIQQEKDRDVDGKFGPRGMSDWGRRGSPTYDAYPHPKRSKSRSPSPHRHRERDRSGSDRRRSRSRDRHKSRGKPSGRERDRERERERERGKSGPKIEFITEFGVSGEAPQSIAPPPSPPHATAGGTVGMERLPSALVPKQILEALHSDPAQVGAVPLPEGFDRERRAMEFKSAPSREVTSAALAKLSKPAPGSGASQRTPTSAAAAGGGGGGGGAGAAAAGTASGAAEKKETPQERLKRIMSKQLTKQIKKDTMAESAKKLEAERVRMEKLAETRRIAQRKSWSRSPPRDTHTKRRHSRSRSRSRSRSPPSHGRSVHGRSRSKTSPSASALTRRRPSRSRSRSRDGRSSRFSRREPSRSISPSARRSRRRSRSWSR